MSKVSFENNMREVAKNDPVNIEVMQHFIAPKNISDADFSEMEKRCLAHYAYGDFQSPDEPDYKAAQDEQRRKAQEKAVAQKLKDQQEALETEYRALKDRILADVLNGSSPDTKVALDKTMTEILHRQAKRSVSSEMDAQAEADFWAEYGVAVTRVSEES